MYVFVWCTPPGMFNVHVMIIIIHVYTYCTYVTVHTLQERIYTYQAMFGVHIIIYTYTLCNDSICTYVKINAWVLKQYRIYPKLFTLPLEGSEGGRVNC